jgi:hypothetical protein
VCVAEEKFLAEFLGAVVERRKHIAAGASCCEYCVREGGSGKREEGLGKREAGLGRGESGNQNQESNE